jgi:hypothetical protein
MPFKLRTAANSDLKNYNGIDYDLLGRIGDIARRGFYPQEAATLKKDEVARLNSELNRVLERMEKISKLMDTAAKRAAARK